ncbi:hypothetical protein SCALM49S_06614 [Streptomyces californicus]
MLGFSHTASVTAAIRSRPPKSRAGSRSTAWASRAALPILPPWAYFVPMPDQSCTVRPVPSLPPSARKSTIVRSALSSCPVAARAYAPSIVMPNSARPFLVPSS